MSGADVYSLPELSVLRQNIKKNELFSNGFMRNDDKVFLILIEHSRRSLRKKNEPCPEPISLEKFASSAGPIIPWHQMKKTEALSSPRELGLSETPAYQANKLFS